MNTMTVLLSIEQANMTAEEYVDYLLNLPFVDWLVPLRGYTEAEPRRRKAPFFGEGWNTTSFAERFTREDAIEHILRGGWLGLKIAKGYVCIDVDNPDAKEAISRSYAKDTYAVQTTRGFHLFYSSPAMEAKTSNLVFPKVDWLDSNHYVVAPYSEPHRIPNDLSVSELPIEFKISPTGTVKDIWQKGMLTALEEGDGRNNVLFSIGRKVKLYLEAKGEADEDVVGSVLNRMNSLFAEPVDGRELDSILRSVFRQPNKEDFSLSDEEVEGENPFAVFKPLSAFREQRREFFLDGVCRMGDVVLVTGAPKSGKSTLIRSIALSCASDKILPTKKGRVLWYMLEEHPADVEASIEKAKQVFGVSAEHIAICSFNTNVFANPFPHFIAGLRQAVLEYQPVAVIVDTVGRVLTLDINDYTSVQKAIEEIRWAVRRLPNPPAVFLVHHTNKNVEMRTPLGSQAFAGSCDVIITNEQEDGGVVMKVVGRGVSPFFNMRSVHLRYSAEAEIVVGFGDDIPEPLRNLLKDIQRGAVRTLVQAIKYNGGALKSDVRRLLRKGVLVCPDGVNIYVNEFSKEAKSIIEGGDDYGLAQHTGLLPEDSGIGTVDSGFSVGSHLDTHGTREAVRDTDTDNRNRRGNDAVASKERGAVAVSVQVEEPSTPAISHTEFGMTWGGAEVIIGKQTQTEGKGRLVEMTNSEYEQERLSVGAPPIQGELKEHNVLPPALRKSFLLYYSVRRGKPIFLSELNPFLDDAVKKSENGVLQNVLKRSQEAWKQTGKQGYPDIDFILKQWRWEEEEPPVDIVSLLNAVYDVIKLPFVRMTPEGLGVSGYAFIYEGRWAFLPVDAPKHEFMLLWKRLKQGEQVSFPVNHAVVEHYAKKGYLFDLYDIDGKDVYVLSRRRYLTNNVEDYLCHVLHL